MEFFVQWNTDKLHSDWLVTYYILDICILRCVFFPLCPQLKAQIKPYVPHNRVKEPDELDETSRSYDCDTKIWEHLVIHRKRHSERR